MDNSIPSKSDFSKYETQMGANVFAVYSALNRVSDENSLAAISVTALSNTTGLSRRSVVFAISRLEYWGYVKRVRNGISLGKSNIYQVASIENLPDRSEGGEP